MPTLIKYDKFSGINNIKQPWELDIKSRTIDSTELVSAINVDITNAGRLKLREGRALSISGNLHSMYANEIIWLAVRDGDLVRIHANLSVETLRSDIGDNLVSYVTVNDIVAYTNSTVIGYVKNGASYTFPSPTAQFKLPLTAGQLITFYNGRLFIAKGNALWWSDVLPFRYGSMDKRRNGRQLAKPITLLIAVDNGLYLSDGEYTYFAQGDDPFGMSLRTVLRYPPIPNMVCELESGLLPFEGVSGTAFAIGTANGICVALNGGNILNVTEKTYSMTTGQIGAMMFRKSAGLNQIVAVTNF